MNVDFDDEDDEAVWPQVGRTESEREPISPAAPPCTTTTSAAPPFVVRQSSSSITIGHGEGPNFVDAVRDGVERVNARRRAVPSPQGSAFDTSQGSRRSASQNNGGDHSGTFQANQLSDGGAADAPMTMFWDPVYGAPVVWGRASVVTWTPERLTPANPLHDFPVRQRDTTQPTTQVATEGGGRTSLGDDRVFPAQVPGTTASAPVFRKRILTPPTVTDARRPPPTTTNRLSEVRLDGIRKKDDDVLAEGPQAAATTSDAASFIKFPFSTTTSAPPPPRPSRLPTSTTAGPLLQPARHDGHIEDPIIPNSSCTVQ